MGGRGGTLKLGQAKLAKYGGGAGGLPGGLGGGSTPHGISFTGGAFDPFSGAPGSGFGAGVSSAGGGPMAGYPGAGPATAGAGIPGAGTASLHVEQNAVFGQDPNHPGYLTFSSNYDAYDWHLQHNFDDSKWASLYPEEQKGVIDYTDFYYSKINTTLRHREKADSQTQAQIDGAKSGLSKSESAADVIVYRGSNMHWTANLLKSNERLSSEELKNMDDVRVLKDADYLRSCIGKVVTDRGFMSSAVTADDAWGADVVYKIYVPKGTSGLYVDPISAHRGEKEWLFNADTQFIVHSIVTDADGIVSELVLEAIP